MATRWMIITITVITLILTGLFKTFVLPVQAETLSGAKWYLRDEDVGIQAIGNNDNDGKSIFCLTSDDCKIVYYDYTNQDLKFYDCDSEACLEGSTVAVDLDNNVGNMLSVFCPASDDCKIAFIDETNTALVFYDCDNAACSAGSRVVLDGAAGCALSGGIGCSADRNAGQYPIVFCPTAVDCKIAYAGSNASVLYFADCDDAVCSSGSISIVDGADNCSLTGCLTDHPSPNNVGEHVSLFCPAADDCKIAVKNGSLDDLRFEDCDNSTCSAGSSTLLDGNTGCALTGADGCSTTGDVGTHSVITCLSSTDCKIAYRSNTYTSVRLADCDNAACSVGSVSVLDGEDSCSLAGCLPAGDGQHPSIYCPASNDCKISYNQLPDRDLRLVDCDNANCDGPGAGSITMIDGSAGCSLANCTADNSGKYSSIFCLNGSDCKLIYYDEVGKNLKFADCQNATCTSGATLTLDGNKIVAGVPGSVTTTRVFGSSANQRLTFVSEARYPNASALALNPGDYILQLHFTNGITAGTLVWHFEIGYCTIASDCQDKTIFAVSSDQSFNSLTASPVGTVHVAGSPMPISGPDNSKWVYLDLVVTTKATGSITIQMNNQDAAAADSYLEFPAASAPTTTPLPTATPSATPLPATATPTVIPTATPAIVTLNIPAAADTSISASKPGVNYGAKNIVGVDNNPVMRSLLLFNVNGIPAGATIVSASLKLNSSDASDISGAVSYVVGSWSEATTWNDAPAVGGWIANLSNPATIDAWSVTDVRPAVGGNGAYNFYLTSASNNNACYKSREAASSQPVLVIEYTQ